MSKTKWVLLALTLTLMFQLIARGLHFGGYGLYVFTIHALAQFLVILSLVLIHDLLILEGENDESVQG